jgi:hypothetical protein
VKKGALTKLQETGHVSATQIKSVYYEQTSEFFAASSDRTTRQGKTRLLNVKITTLLSRATKADR